MINCNSDKFHGRDCDGEDENIQKISEILNNCKSYAVDELNKMIQQLTPSFPANLNAISTTPQKSLYSTHFSLYFINIDGNTTNVDNLLVELTVNVSITNFL
jgi:hypothetical protein